MAHRRAKAYTRDPYSMKPGRQMVGARLRVIILMTGRTGMNRCGHSVR